jgi:hypothetical protein
MKTGRKYSSNDSGRPGITEWKAMDTYDVAFRRFSALVMAFARAFEPPRKLLAGGDSSGAEDFLYHPAKHWVSSSLP